MSDTTISNLQTATTLNGTEYVPITQAGVTKKTTTGAISGAPITGNLSISGNITANNATITNSITANTLTSNAATITGNLTVSTVTITGNIITANVTGNILANNATITNTVTAANVIVSSLAASGPTQQGIVYVDNTGLLTVDTADLLWDDTNKRLGINQQGNTASAKLDVHASDMSVPIAQFNQTIATQSPTNGAVVQLQCDPGNAIVSGSRLGVIQFTGVTDSAHTVVVGAAEQCFATQNWSAGAAGSKLQFNTTQNNTAVRTTALTLDQDQSAIFGGNTSMPALNFYTVGNGDEMVLSTDTSFMRQGTLSTVTSGNLYTLLGNVNAMMYWSHNVGINSSGNFAGRDDTGTAMIWTFLENDFINIYTAPGAAAGNVPVFNTTPTQSFNTANGTLSVTGGYRLSGNAKIIVTTGAATSQTIPTGQQYTYFNTTASSMTTTLPTANASIDGTQITVVANANVATATWVSSGATFIGAPGSFTANTPVRMIYDNGTTKWYPA